jgi:hypothetical protein
MTRAPRELKAHERVELLHDLQAFDFDNEPFYDRLLDAVLGGDKDLCRWWMVVNAEPDKLQDKFVAAREALRGHRHLFADIKAITASYYEIQNQLAGSRYKSPARRRKRIPRRKLPPNNV